MKVWIKIDKHKAIMAGKNEYGWRPVEIDMGKLSTDERAYVVSCQDAHWMKDENGKYLDGVDRYMPAIEGYSVAEATEEDAMQCIRDASVEMKKKETEKQAEIEKILSAPIESLIVARQHSTTWEVAHYSQKSQYTRYSTDRRIIDPRLDQKYVEIDKEVDKKNQEVNQEIDLLVAAGKAREEVEKAKVAEEVKKAKAIEEIEKIKKMEKVVKIQAQIKAWVMEKGTPNQKKRYEIGLLPDAEIIDAIREETYSALDGYGRYEKIQGKDVCTCEYPIDDEDCGVDYEVTPSSSATADQYDALEAIIASIHAVHPNARITLMNHVGASEVCEKTITRKSAKVEIEVGELAFSREYAIAE